MTTRKKKAAKIAGRGAKRAAKVATIAAVTRETPAKGKKEQITLRLDADVIDFFRAMGDGYQAKMNGYLALAMANAQMQTATEMPRSSWYDESPRHEAMANRLFRPKKEQLTLRLDAGVMEHFRSQGKGYQSKMNRSLRLIMVELLRIDEGSKEKTGSR